jgi:hypothetical protein
MPDDLYDVRLRTAEMREGYALLNSAVWLTGKAGGDEAVISVYALSRPEKGFAKPAYRRRVVARIYRNRYQFSVAQAIDWFETVANLVAVSNGVDTKWLFPHKTKGLTK